MSLDSKVAEKVVKGVELARLLLWLELKLLGWEERPEQSVIPASDPRQRLGPGLVSVALASVPGAAGYPVNPAEPSIVAVQNDRGGCW